MRPQLLVDLVVDRMPYSWSILVHNDIITQYHLRAGVDTSRRLGSEEFGVIIHCMACCAVGYDTDG